MVQLECPNLLVDIFDKSKGVKTGHINPLTMVIKQNRRDVQNRVNALIKAGANPDLKFDYYVK